MRCPNPKCKSRNIGVVKTIPLTVSKVRLRICYDCHTVFETEERIIPPADRPMQGSLFDSAKAAMGKKPGTENKSRA